MPRQRPGLLYVIGAIDHEKQEEFLKEQKQLFFPRRKIDTSTILINSSGGILECGLGMYDRLLRSSVPVQTVIEGEAASSATLIFLAGSKRLISRHSSVMVHLPYFTRDESIIQENDARYLTSQLRTSRKTILDIFFERTGTSKDVLRKMMRRITNLNAEEAVKYGFAHGII